MPSGTRRVPPGLPDDFTTAFAPEDNVFILTTGSNRFNGRVVSVEPDSLLVRIPSTRKGLPPGVHTFHRDGIKEVERTRS